MAGACLAAFTGCRLLGGGADAWRGAASDERLGAAARSLGSDLWAQNPAWSPLNQLPEAPVWSPDVSLTRWSHAASRRPGNAKNNSLAVLAKRDDLVGWNAAILLSQRDPRAAGEVVETLERLVLHPPSYVPEGRFSDDRDSLAPIERRFDKFASGETKAPNERKPAAPLSISQNMRCAAAEAWCLVLGAREGDPEEALAPAGRALQDAKLPPKVAEELWRGIACRVRPDRIPGLEAALNDANRESPRAKSSRRAAAEACVVYAVQRRLRGDNASSNAIAPASGGDDPEALAASVEEDSPWPAGFWRLRNDADPRLRQQLGELVAVIGHPAAFLVLKSQMTDVDTQVREAALVNLGLLATVEARSELVTQAKRPEERRRELAVRGLACQGPAALAPFTKDSSAKVRLEAARGVWRHPGAPAARVLRDLLNDSSLEVQGACVQAIERWPDALATTLLLESLAGSAFKTRQAALRQLEERRGGGLAFPLLAGPQERALRVQQWSREWNIPDSAVERVQELTRAGSPQLDQARLADFREKLLSAGPPGSNESVVHVAEWAGELTPADLPIVERLLGEVDEPQVDLLLHHVLPRLSPAYGDLVQLEASEALSRREAASNLGRMGHEASLSPAVCRRLLALMRTEQDGLVWRFVMLGVFRDGSDEAARLALLAINSVWPDVRVLGCEYIGRHEQSEHAAWLLPLFYDANKAVQLSAVTAAGKCRNPIVLDGRRSAGDEPAQRGLRPLLTESQGQLQFAVVASMSRLGDPQAMQELVRLALDVNSTSRLDVVETMGETGQTRFVEPLIRLAWTEQNHHVRQAALATLQKLVPPAEQPQRLGRAQTVPQAVEIWTAWWEDRRNKL